MEAMHPQHPPAAWSLVVPLKPLARAKSRLAGGGAHSAGTARAALALAFAQDTVHAALASTAVRSVAVVTDDARAAAELRALGADIVPDAPGDGLNAALAYGAAAVRTRLPDVPVAALNADLPALRSAELTHVLNTAAAFPRAFLADAAGIGTTLLSALPGSELRPAFGIRSRERHLASGAAEITLSGVQSVRTDVDTESDLAAALALGVGPFTARRGASTAPRSAAFRGSASAAPRPRGRP